MKKNILFLALTLLITAPLAASDYPYPMEGHDRNLELLFPYESDKDADGPYVQGYHTRNPKNIFEETKALFALSETQPTEKALY